MIRVYFYHEKRTVLTFNKEYRRRDRENRTLGTQRDCFPGRAIFYYLTLFLLYQLPIRSRRELKRQRFDICSLRDPPDYRKTVYFTKVS